MNTSPVPDTDGNGVQQSGNGVLANPGKSDVYLKLLVPNAAVGALLGRGGDYVTKLQQETGTKIKMSRPNEFYPGTMDRVCLISGLPDSVARSCGLIVRKVCDRPADSNNLSVNNEMDVGSPTPRRSNGERTKQLKLLVTNSTAGMVIGKGGSNIKEIKEESGALIQISQKATPAAGSSFLGSQGGSLHAERLITISGEFDELECAVRLIIRKIESDPQSSACLSISYADANANVSPSSVQAVYGVQQSFGDAVSPRFASLRSRELNGGGDRGQQFDRQLRNAPYHDEYGTQRAVEQVAAMLRSSGFAEPAVLDITNAMGTLMAYGLLNVSDPHSSGALQYSLLGLQLQTNGFSQPAFPHGAFQQSYPHPAYLHPQVSAPASANASSFLSSSASAPTYVTAGNPVQGNDDALSLSSASFSVPVQSAMLDVDPNGNPSSATYTTMSDGQTIVPINVYEVLNQGNLPLGALNPTSLLGPGMQLTGMNLNDVANSGRYDDATGVNGSGAVQRDVKVHESMIGVIFGVGGKWIAELQAQTGASIQVSKKGVYAPATHDRVVTLRGSQTSVLHAYGMIMQKLNGEEERRASRRQTRGERQSAEPEFTPTA